MPESNGRVRSECRPGEGILAGVDPQERVRRKRRGTARGEEEPAPVLDSDTRVDQVMYCTGGIKLGRIVCLSSLAICRGWDQARTGAWLVERLPTVLES